MQYKPPTADEIAAANAAKEALLAPMVAAMSAEGITLAHVFGLCHARWGATKEQIDAAITVHGDDECEIDDYACVSEGDGGYWVQAWVWVDEPEDDEDAEPDEADEDQEER